MHKQLITHLSDEHIIVTHVIDTHIIDAHMINPHIITHVLTHVSDSQASHKLLIHVKVIHV